MLTSQPGEIRNQGRASFNVFCPWGAPSCMARYVTSATPTHIFRANLCCSCRLGERTFVVSDWIWQLYLLRVTHRVNMWRGKKLWQLVGNRCQGALHRQRLPGETLVELDGAAVGFFGSFKNERVQDRLITASLCLCLSPSLSLSLPLSPSLSLSLPLSWRTWPLPHLRQPQCKIH